MITGIVASVVAPAGPVAGAEWDPATHSVGGILLTNANLTSEGLVGGAWRSVRATAGVSTGQYYWEILLVGGSPNNELFGVANSSLSQTNFIGSGTGSWGYQSSGIGPLKWNNSSNTAYGVAVTSADVLQVALDASAGKLWFGKNGTWMNSGDPVAGTGAAFTGLTGTLYPAASYIGTGSSTTARFASGDWGHTPPTGYIALPPP